MTFPTLCAFMSGGKSGTCRIVSFSACPLHVIKKGRRFPWIHSRVKLQENVDFTDFKPQYLDFENPLLVRMFGKMIADSSFHVIIEEMLPDIEELALIDEGKGYVSELLVELSQRV